MLREDQTEVEIMETVDYGDTDYRCVMEIVIVMMITTKGSLGEMGYQSQEFDDNGELVNSKTTMWKTITQIALAAVDEF